MRKNFYVVRIGQDEARPQATAPPRDPNEIRKSVYIGEGPLSSSTVSKMARAEVDFLGRSSRNSNKQAHLKLTARPARAVTEVRETVHITTNISNNRKLY